MVQGCLGFRALGFGLGRASGSGLWVGFLGLLGINLPIGSIVVPSCGSYLGSYQVIPKRNYHGA